MVACSYFRNGKLNSGSAYGIKRLQKLMLTCMGPMMLSVYEGECELIIYSISYHFRYILEKCHTVQVIGTHNIEKITPDFYWKDKQLKHSPNILFVFSRRNPHGFVGWVNDEQKHLNFKTITLQAVNFSLHLKCTSVFHSKQFIRIAP